jgi:hypothetical protein
MLDGVEVRLGLFRFLLFFAHLFFFGAFLFLLYFEEGEIGDAFAASHVVVDCTDGVDMVQHLIFRVEVDLLLFLLFLAIDGGLILIGHHISHIIVDHSSSGLWLLLGLFFEFFVEVEDVGLVDSHVFFSG